MAKSWEAKFEGVKAQGFLDVANYRGLLRSADCLVICRNFDEKSRAYTELSFHNKLPEYLASGTPIICISPSWDQTSEYLKANAYGYVINEDSRECLIDGITNMIGNHNRYKKTANEAKKACFVEFNIKNIENSFIDKLYAISTI